LGSHQEARCRDDPVLWRIKGARLCGWQITKPPPQTKMYTQSASFLRKSNSLKILIDPQLCFPQRYHFLCLCCLFVCLLFLLSQQIIWKSISMKKNTTFHKGWWSHKVLEIFSSPNATIRHMVVIKITGCREVFQGESVSWHVTYFRFFSIFWCCQPFWKLCTSTL
jgi:hypothetical protein